MKGYILRQEMKDSGVRVNDIAAKLGISHVAVSKVIHGRARSARVQAAIAEAINRPVSEVFPEQEQS